MENKETLEEAGEKLYPNRDYFLHSFQNLERKAFTKGAKWQQERSYSEEEVNEMFDTLKRNSIDNVATINNVDLFISSWKQQFKKK